MLFITGRPLRARAEGRLARAAHGVATRGWESGPHLFAFGWAGGLGSRTAPNAWELPTLLALCDPPALGVVPLAEEAEEHQ